MFDIRKDFMLNLHMHDVNPNVQVTTANSTGNDLSPEMKVFYSDYLIDNAKPLLVHDQFGQKHPIPKNGGNSGGSGNSGSSTGNLTISHTLKVGDTGDEVLAVQKRLAELGYLTATPDGI